MQSNSRPLITEQALADYLGVAVQTPRKWRLTGEGPRYIKIGRAVRYHPDDVDAFVAASRRRSTSDTGEAV
jgi:hypothetical protein